MTLYVNLMLIGGSSRANPVMDRVIKFSAGNATHGEMDSDLRLYRLTQSHQIWHRKQMFQGLLIIVISMAPYGHNFIGAPSRVWD